MDLNTDQFDVEKRRTEAAELFEWSGAVSRNSAALRLRLREIIAWERKERAETLRRSEETVRKSLELLQRLR